MKRESSRQETGNLRLTPMSTKAETIDEAARLMRVIARPRWIDTRESALRKAARSIGLSPSQARRIVYRESKSIPAHVMDNIRAAYRALELKAEAFADHQHALAEAAQRERGIPDAASTDDDDGAARLDREPLKRGRSRGLGEG
jgi:Asp-tRNA(Asn)/Glu-tRNA(Gln) amidotransferase A subunit family amidase